MTAYTYELQQGQQLWSQTVPDYIVISTPESERKRQETIFELIYTEQDFFQDLEYVVKVHILHFSVSICIQIYIFFLVLDRTIAKE